MEKIIGYFLFLVAGIAIGLSLGVIRGQRELIIAQERSDALTVRLGIVQIELEESRASLDQLRSELADSTAGIERSLERVTTIEGLIDELEAFLANLSDLGSSGL